MPFGLTNALATFMHIINDIFHPHLGRFVVLYMGWHFDFQSDLGRTPAACTRGAWTTENSQVAGKMKEVLLRADICPISGFRCWSGGYSRRPSKRLPIGLSLLQLLLYRVSWEVSIFTSAFIHNLSHMARLLHQLSRQQAFTWTNHAEESFQKLKKTALCFAPVLQLPDL